ncbi:hydrolase, TatD family [Sphingobacterium spiritivorum ATCC 33300]|uniref:Hydrolase, TatD family n=1 Tax=Sphingobacterium spiritivorum ATCC 33300 TaxID=525372 RepID=C2FWG3_SPHSI|nr:TatD family hydrolase [Sphingobacterium spiritivorum]EEI92714.1 hydrolase, TatD family [Sphingobacterium spiritivorum ATCC 33300]QQS94226.1 TatD family hydrolase [Sphingobacterium spiritivorum]
MPTPYILTDTHTHLYYHIGTPLMEEQMQRCFDRGIERIFLPNVNTESIPKVMDTVHAYPQNCFPMLGLHPCDVKENYREELSSIEEALSTHKVYAIGEIGLDLYWDKTTLNIQKEAFRIQVQWAKDLRLPIDIHCREAFDELFELLDELKDDKLFGVLHCFTGTLDQAKRAIDLGFALGIGGVVTYKKSGLDAVVKEIDLEHIVLETDAPYLAPVPFRGKPNESSYLHYIAEKVADLHEVGIEKVAAVTTANSKRIFGI